MDLNSLEGFSNLTKLNCVTYTKQSVRGDVENRKTLNEGWKRKPKTTVTKHKRNKPTKSCHFCQEKKIKCDRNPTGCHNCNKRHINCVYCGKSKINEKTVYQKLSKKQLISVIEELKAKIDSREKKVETNPVYDLTYVSTKHGRRIKYGATSYRSIIAAQDPFLKPYYSSVYHAIKSNRKKWKRKNNYSNESEVSIVDDDLSFMCGETILSCLCSALPYIEDIEAQLVLFFNSTLHKCFNIVDEDKVLEDLEHVFLRGPRDFESGKSKAISLELGEKKNYYRVGVITEILCLAYYQEDVPGPLKIFNKFLTSFITAKCLYVERVQYFLLRYVYKSVFGMNGGDTSHCLFAFSLAANTAIHIGLNNSLEIDCFQERSEILNNIWLWILFVDLEISFSMGTPLHISDDFVNSEIYSESYTCTNEVLRRTVPFMRHALNELYSKNKAPAMEEIISDLNDLLKSNFRPLSFYLQSTNFEDSQFDEILVLFLISAMSSNFSSLQMILFHQNDPDLLNNIIQMHINSIRISLNLLKLAHLSDVKSSFNATKKTGTFPNLQIARYLFNWSMPRVLNELFCTLLKLSKSESSFLGYQLCSINVSQKLNEQFDSWSMNHSIPLKLGDITEYLNELFEGFYSNCSCDLLEFLSDSYYFVINSTLEKSFREVLLECVGKQPPIGAENLDRQTNTVSASRSEDVFTTLDDMTDFNTILSMFESDFTNNEALFF